MQENILDNLDNPRQMERLYRMDKTLFKEAFNQVYPQVSGNLLAIFWNERLNFEDTVVIWEKKRELIFILFASLIAGFFIKLPDIFSLPEEFFYPRNLAFAIFPALAFYFAWKQKSSQKLLFAIGAALLVSLTYINVLPGDDSSDTLVLACLHIPLILWAILGFTFVDGQLKNYSKGLSFLRYNGDLVVMTTLIFIAGGILTVITIGLFSLINVSIEEFYFRYIVLAGLPTAPILGTFITQANPQLVNKVSPLIAKIFSPLVLIMLVSYIITIIVSGQNPYTNREFLLMFNLLLIGVMALILFSVAESAKSSKKQWEIWLLFLLSSTTIIVNLIALSAIVFRISEWGISPNRLAVLGSNLLILIHLFIVAFKLFQVIRKQATIEKVATSIVAYIPVYIIWAIIVVFIFPVAFQFN